VNKAPGKESITAAIRVDAARIRYSFGLPVTRHDLGNYSEHITLECRGELEASRHMRALPIEAVILASREMTKLLVTPDDKAHKSIAIGVLSYRKNNTSCLLSLPFDSLALIAPELISGRISHLIFRGMKKGGGQMSVQSVWLDSAESLVDDHGLER
jgi:hypothetical protein